ncbi:MAG: P-loop NTPase [Sporomusaceae bacterium]|nr:P-loop NTPase [Sporomusaceae bacterium]
MSENCSQSCSSCGEACAERDGEQQSLLAKTHELNHVKKVIGIVSGKGGVGKSLVTSLLAVRMKQRGYHTAILDADITGPSIPKVFGIKEKAMGSEMGIFPLKSSQGIKMMSANLLLENDTDPVLWRGPMIGNMVTQFWTDVIWGNMDFLFVDMPPGTGDVPLTVFQSLPVDGIIVVTSPQELVSMIVAKAVKMAEMMHIPILGLVENMSYFKCPDNQKEYKIFGESHVDETAAQYGLAVLGKLPIDPAVAQLCDQGAIEQFDGNWLDQAIAKLEKMEAKSMKKIAVACEGESVSGHFGHCKNFMVFDTEGEAILAAETVMNEGHGHESVADYLESLAVKVVISGGMGQGAMDLLTEKGIEYLTGATGDARTAVKKYLLGELQSTESVCQCDGHHEHGHHHSHS